jgi:hypothetical protein
MYDVRTPSAVPFSGSDVAVACSGGSGRCAPPASRGQSQGPEIFIIGHREEIFARPLPKLASSALSFSPARDLANMSAISKFCTQSAQVVVSSCSCSYNEGFNQAELTRWHAATSAAAPGLFHPIDAASKPVAGCCLSPRDLLLAHTAAQQPCGRSLLPIELDKECAEHSKPVECTMLSGKVHAVKVAALRSASGTADGRNTDLGHQ